MKSLVYSLTLIFALILSAATLQSCKKEGCTDEDAINYDSEAEKDDDSCEYEELTFTVTNPANGSTFGLGATVHIDAMIESTGEIHGYEVHLINTSDGNAEVLHIEQSVDHVSMVHIHEEWVNNVTGHSDMELEITAITDHDGSSESHTVHFHCHPM